MLQVACLGEVWVEVHQQERRLENLLTIPEARQMGPQLDLQSDLELVCLLVLVWIDLSVESM